MSDPKRHEGIEVSIDAEMYDFIEEVGLVDQFNDSLEMMARQVNRHPEWKEAHDQTKRAVLELTAFGFYLGVNAAVLMWSEKSKKGHH